MHFQPVAVAFEPGPDRGVLVAGGVVLNQDRFLAAVPPGELFEQAEIGSGIEEGRLAVIEARAPEFDGAEKLYALAFSRHGDLRRVPDAAPGGVDRRVLPEAGLAGEQQRSVP